MRTTFAALGLPEILVTDNGPSFTSGEFDQFVKSNGIRHVKTAPYHPTSNGLAKQSVQIFKGDNYEEAQRWNTRDQSSTFIV